MVLFNPPHSICKTHMDLFEESLQGLIYSKTEGAVIRPAKYGDLLDRCKGSNTPGGCFELFQVWRAFHHQAKKIPKECSSDLGSRAEVRKILDEGPELLTLLAWGSEPPKSALLKYGWLEASNLALYCDLKDLHLALYGKESWLQFQTKMFQTLPGADKLVRAQAWELMILSSRCEQWQP